MSELKYTLAEKFLLKDSTYNENWLHDKIAENTSILGLGELDVIDRERKQKTGRLDMLLADTPNDKRYEVEIMLGQLNESHIIRCIEYWDIEKKRYPHYDHCAVIIAERITSRFLNVLSLFNGQIPLIAIQLNALKVENALVLNFVTVLDQFSLRRDDTVEVKLQETNREYWEKKAVKKTVDVADKILQMLNEKLDKAQQLNYNKYYIGLTDGIKSRNFIYFKPKKQFTHIYFEVENISDWAEKLDENGISATTDKKYVQITVKPEEIKKHEEVFKNLISDAVEFYMP